MFSLANVFLLDGNTSGKRITSMVESYVGVDDGEGRGELEGDGVLKSPNIVSMAVGLTSSGVG